MELEDSGHKPELAVNCPPTPPSVFTFCLLKDSQAGHYIYITTTLMCNVPERWNSGEYTFIKYDDFYTQFHDKILCEFPAEYEHV